MVFIDHLLNLVLDEEVNYTLHILRGRYAPAPFWVHFIDERGFENLLLLLLLNLAGWLLWLYYDLGLVILFVVVIILIHLLMLFGVLKERLISSSVVVRELHALHVGL